MFVHGARNIGIFTGFFHPTLAGQPALYVSEDRNAALPLQFLEGMPRPADWEPVNIAGHAVPDGKGGLQLRVTYWERAGHDVIHPKTDWTVPGAKSAGVALTEFSPITKPGFMLSDDIKAMLAETSGFGPGVEAALEGDEHSREILFRPLSRRMKGQTLVTGVVVKIARNIVQPEPPSKWPFYWGLIALGPLREHIVSFKIRSLSDNFGGVMARFRSGPTPITLAGTMRSALRADGTTHTFLDCEAALLVSRQDFEGGTPPAWMMAPPDFQRTAVAAGE